MSQERDDLAELIARGQGGAIPGTDDLDLAEYILVSKWLTARLSDAWELGWRSGHDDLMGGGETNPYSAAEEPA